MSKRMKVFIAAILAGVLTLSVVGGVVLAQDNQSTTPTPTPTRDIFLEKLAGQLGITVDELKAKIVNANEATLDELVAQGRITEQQKEQILERQQERLEQGWNCPGFGGNWNGNGGGMMGGGMFGRGGHCGYGPSASGQGPVS